MTTGDYTEEFKRQREAEQAENAEVRAAYRKRLDDERQAKIREGEAREAAALAEAKASEKRQWLIAHPLATEADFETKAWPLIREERYTGFDAMLKREIAAQRAHFAWPRD